MMGGDQSVLIVIDVQERLCPVMNDPRRVLMNGARLVRAARILGLPVVVTEQYPKGLGPTMHDIRAEAPRDAADCAYFEKLTFSIAADPPVMAHLDGLGRRQAVICGIEMHVCVLQSALRLRARGWDVFVVADACSSRLPESEEAARTRMVAAGIQPVTTEMALFEWLESKENPAFKTIMDLIR
ncbi:MAG: hydrolase [Rhodospirillum sp.]|nr:hydrolase [Rhodospirillum sp.]MCF8489352.1 hydrolase [Rhodospirillum sp.]MCF8500708.1 hydrolase [Rhodospirillum sp.]